MPSPSPNGGGSPDPNGARVNLAVTRVVVATGGGVKRPRPITDSRSNRCKGGGRRQRKAINETSL